MEQIAGGLFGIIVGTFFTAHYLTQEGNARTRFFLAVIGNGVLGSCISIVLKYSSTPPSGFVSVLVFYLSGFLLSYICTTAIFALLLRRANKKVNFEMKVRIIDLLFGLGPKAWEEYRQLKKRIWDESKRTSLKKCEEDLKKREEALKAREDVVEMREESIDGKIKAITKQQHLKLPGGSIIGVDNKMLKSLPNYMMHVTNYINMQNLQIIQFLDEIEKEEWDLNTTEGKKLFTTAYLTSLCSNIAECFFTRSDVRVHFRSLQGEHYKGIAIWEDNTAEREAEDLPRIPVMKSLISRAGELKCSLLYSLHLDCCTIFSHMEGWEDALVSVFPGYIKNKKPGLSMCISVNNALAYKDTLYLMCYLKIESVIKLHLDGVRNNLVF